ncbi:PfkB family carbohydrate kinase [Ancylomarina longa]|uniref:Fructokinase n=1 Tax=Ancylomarina longa TaxID=2487017 RepID=A0A434AY81_9BACT|nr:PfkB family carbohydrate kinase [Ancylomarina longa]RUT79532.1 fructokinase [Ancylomarina longa]
MRTIYTIGDCVLDVFFEQGKPFESKPGGSFLNASVSLARLGAQVCLLSELGTDKVGESILQFLMKNKVNTKYISRFSDTNSNLALAFLDDSRNADYSFYKTRIGLDSIIQFPTEVKPNDIILFGSFLAIKKEFRSSLIAFLKYCRKQDAILIYDPNFRSQHLRLLKEVLPYIKENMALADIVKASNEDFQLICGAKSASNAHIWMENFSDAMLVYTANKNAISVCNPNEIKVEVPQITPLSTVGAGDTCNAAIAYFLIKNRIDLNEIKNLNYKEIQEMVQTAITFSQKVCMSFDNFLEEDFARNFRL